MDTITSNMNTEDINHVTESLNNDIKELERHKQFLESENETCVRQLRKLKGEVDGINISISSSQQIIFSINKQKKQCLNDTQKLSVKKEYLINRNSQLHLQIKSVSSDHISSKALLDNLMNEMNYILDEKKILLTRLNQVQSGLSKLSTARKQRVPEIQKCNDIIRQVHSSMKKVHHKMEISMIFQRDTAL